MKSSGFGYSGFWGWCKEVVAASPGRKMLNLSVAVQNQVL